MKFTRTTIPFAIALLCACPVMVTAGTFVTGKCGSGEIATTAELMSARKSIEEGMSKGFESLGKIVLKTSAEEQKRLEYNTTAIVEALKQYAVLNKADQIRETLTGPTAQPSNLCEQPEMAAVMQNGRRAERQIAKSVAEAMQKRAQSVIEPVELQQELNEEWAQATDAQSLYKTTMSETDLFNVTRLTGVLTNPNPLPEKPSGKLDKAEQQRAEALRNLDMMRRSLGTSLFQDIIAWRSPTNQNGDLLQAMANSAGAQAEVPDIVNGMASMAAYWEYVIQSRTGNPNWYSELATRSETALLREQVMLTAQQLEMQIRTYDLLQKMGGVLANMQSLTVDEDRIRHGYAQ